MDGLKATDQLQSYEAAKNKDKINSDWSDQDGYFYGYSASALGIAYNTKNTTQAPTDWSDLAKADWQNKINIPDPSLSGSAVDFLFGYTAAEKQLGARLIVGRKMAYKSMVRIKKPWMRLLQARKMPRLQV